MAANLHQIRIYTDLRADPFKMQPRLSKVKGYIVSTMPLFFSLVASWRGPLAGAGWEKGRIR